MVLEKYIIQMLNFMMRPTLKKLGKCSLDSSELRKEPLTMKNTVDFAVDIVLLIPKFFLSQAVFRPRPARHFLIFKLPGVSFKFHPLDSTETRPQTRF